MSTEKRISLDQLPYEVLRRWSLPEAPDFETHYGTPEVAALTVKFLSGMATWAEGNIVEIGTDTGLGAFSLALGPIHPYEVHSFDIQPDRSSYATKLAKDFGISNVFFHVGTCESVQQIVPEPIKLIEIDGYHLYPEVIKDIRTLAPLLHPEGRIIFHDFDPRQWRGRMKSNGVAHAICKFMHDNPEWHGCFLGGYWFCLSRTPNHPLTAWNVDDVMKEIKENGYEC